MSAPNFPESRQAELKASLEAAALPRWCDQALLAALLNLKAEDSAERLAHLRSLGMVEPVLAHGKEAVHVPAATRQVLRRIMSTVEPTRFRALSLRAAGFFENQTTPAARIEWIFHLLCGDPERGASELEKLDHEWTERGHADDRQALAAVLRELEDTGMVAGRARVWVLLVMAWMYELKGETLRWQEVSELARGAARAAGDCSAEAEALCLVGDARMAQYQFDEAKAAFDDYLSLSQLLAQQHADDPRWQRKLALAYSRVGDAAQAQGQLETAQGALVEYLNISRRMARQYPQDPSWQREWGVAHCKIGHIRKAQGHIERARAEFNEYMAAFQRLVDLDPDNIGWQRELAVACGLLANIRMSLEGADHALIYYEKASRLLANALDKSPGMAQWAEDKRLIDKELANCRRAAEVQKKVKGGLSWLQDKLPF